MVSSTGSQVESAIFQRVIGSLGSEIEFRSAVDVGGIEDNCLSAEDNGMRDVENSLSGLENNDEGTAEAIAD